MRIVNMNVRNLLKNLEYNKELLTLENTSTLRQKTYTGYYQLTEYMKNKKVVAYTYSFSSKEIIIYYE